MFAMYPPKCERGLLALIQLPFVGTENFFFKKKKDLSIFEQELIFRARKSESILFEKVSEEIEILHVKNLLDFGNQNFRVKIW